AVSPGADLVPDHSDPGQIGKLSYVSSLQRVQTATLVSSLTVVESRGQPTTIDVSNGDWDEVTIGDSQGIYWRGAPYLDIAGNNWIGDVSVLMVERPDMVTTFIGQNKEGVTKEMLLA